MRRLLLAGATALAIGAGAFEFYVKPTVLEQAPALVDEALATTVNGTVRYDKLDIDWAGNAHVKNATVTDAKGLTVARVPDIEVSWNLWQASLTALRSNSRKFGCGKNRTVPGILPI